MLCGGISINRVLFIRNREQVTVRTVRKRDGSVEPFSSEKIIRSAVKAGAPDVYARKIAQEAEEDLSEETTSADIRAFVLLWLQKENLEWDHNWRRHEFEAKQRPRTGKP